MATITGTSGNDVLTGTAGNDLIDGAGGIDTISAGAGDDILRVLTPPPLGNTLQSMIDGGAGRDILDMTGLTGTLDVLIRTDGLVQAGIIGTPNNFFRFTEMLAARGFEEVQVGPGGSNVEVDLGAVNQTMSVLDWKIAGNIGSDTISDGRGSDTIAGGAGRDLVTFHGGTDIVDLGEGDDSYTVGYLAGYSGHAQVDGGSGTDTLVWNADSIPQSISVDLAAGHAQAWTADLLISGFENAYIGLFSGDERLPYPIPSWHADIAGDDGANQLHVILPDEGVATVGGRGGNDAIDANGSEAAALIAYGGAGSDSVGGSDGADWINGGGHVPGDALSPDLVDDGSDTLLGRGGNDHIFGNAQSSVQGALDGGDYIDAGAGSDYANGNGGNDTIYGGAGSDRLYGGAGDDYVAGDQDLTFPDGAGNDHLNGNKGNDTLVGGFGDDDLYGGQGDDVLRGGEGRDYLSGDIGNDTLDAGGGLDTLVGGAGADLFQFLAVGTAPWVPVDGTPLDGIADFTHGVDGIQLAFHVTGLIEGGSASGLVQGVDVANILLQAHAGDDEVVAVQMGADTVLFFASSGQGAVDDAVRLDGVDAATLRLADFL